VCECCRSNNYKFSTTFNLHFFLKCWFCVLLTNYVIFLLISHACIECPFGFASFFPRFFVLVCFAKGLFLKCVDASSLHMIFSSWFYCRRNC
jgi:hypothetical protein